MNLASFHPLGQNGVIEGQFSKTCALSRCTTRVGIVFLTRSNASKGDETEKERFKGLRASSQWFST